MVLPSRRGGVPVFSRPIRKPIFSSELPKQEVVDFYFTFILRIIFFFKSWKKFIFFCNVSYACKKSLDFASILKILMVGYFPQVDFNVVYKQQRTIGELFPFKD